MPVRTRSFSDSPDFQQGALDGLRTESKELFGKLQLLEERSQVRRTRRAGERDKVGTDEVHENVSEQSYTWREARTEDLSDDRFRYGREREQTFCKNEFQGGRATVAPVQRETTPRSESGLAPNSDRIRDMDKALSPMFHGATSSQRPKPRSQQQLHPTYGAHDLRDVKWSRCTDSIRRRDDTFDARGEYSPIGGVASNSPASELRSRTPVDPSGFYYPAIPVTPIPIIKAENVSQDLMALSLPNTREGYVKADHYPPDMQITPRRSESDGSGRLSSKNQFLTQQSQSLHGVQREMSSFLRDYDSVIKRVVSTQSQHASRLGSGGSLTLSYEPSASNPGLSRLGEKLYQGAARRSLDSTHSDNTAATEKPDVEGNTVYAVEEKVVVLRGLPPDVYSDWPVPVQRRFHRALSSDIRAAMKFASRRLPEVRQDELRVGGLCRKAGVVRTREGRSAESAFMVALLYRVSLPELCELFTTIVAEGSPSAPSGKILPLTAARQLCNEQFNTVDASSLAVVLKHEATDTDSSAGCGRASTIKTQLHQPRSRSVESRSPNNESLRKGRSARSSAKFCCCTATPTAPTNHTNDTEEPVSSTLSATGEGDTRPFSTSLTSNSSDRTCRRVATGSEALDHLHSDSSVENDTYPVHTRMSFSKEERATSNLSSKSEEVSSVIEREKFDENELKCHRAKDKDLTLTAPKGPLCQQHDDSGDTSCLHIAFAPHICPFEEEPVFGLKNKVDELRDKEDAYDKQLAHLLHLQAENRKALRNAQEDESHRTRRVTCSGSNPTTAKLGQVDGSFAEPSPLLSQTINVVNAHSMVVPKSPSSSSVSDEPATTRAEQVESPSQAHKSAPRYSSPHSMSASARSYTKSLSPTSKKVPPDRSSPRRLSPLKSMPPTDVRQTSPPQIVPPKVHSAWQHTNKVSQSTKLSPRKWMPPPLPQSRPVVSPPRSAGRPYEMFARAGSNDCATDGRAASPTYLAGRLHKSPPTKNSSPVCRHSGSAPFPERMGRHLSARHPNDASAYAGDALPEANDFRISNQSDGELEPDRSFSYVKNSSAHVETKRSDLSQSVINENAIGSQVQHSSNRTTFAQQQPLTFERHSLHRPAQHRLPRKSDSVTVTPGRDNVNAVRACGPRDDTQASSESKSYCFDNSSKLASDGPAKRKRGHLHHDELLRQQQQLQKQQKELQAQQLQSLEQISFLQNQASQIIGSEADFHQRKTVLSKGGVVSVYTQPKQPIPSDLHNGWNQGVQRSRDEVIKAVVRSPRNSPNRLPPSQQVQSPHRRSASTSTSTQIIQLRPRPLKVAPTSICFQHQLNDSSTPAAITSYTGRFDASGDQRATARDGSDSSPASVSRLHSVEQQSRRVRIVSPVSEQDSVASTPK
ncbi:hypothetical protein DIPPA_70159 [Diplonema papillatum]|nr:hypothetical protein DIPPA_70159 [Diplonema papillatum]